MDGDLEVLKRMYDHFNARNIDGVLAALADDVAWANGMDGGHVHGREACSGELDTPMGHRQSARRTREFRQGCGRIGCRKGPTVCPRSQRQAAAGSNA